MNYVNNKPNFHPPQQTHTQQFIEDAIKGGWDTADYTHQKIKNRTEWLAKEPQPYLLDPKAWEAVGKARIWFNSLRCGACLHSTGIYLTEATREHGIPGHLFYMHRFIDHLADGLSIEDALSKLV